MPSTIETRQCADPYLEDASGYHGEADRIAVPATLEDIQEIARHCRERAIPLTVAGAGTGLTGARVPHGGWLMSLERFRLCDVSKGLAHCGAGLLLSDLAAAAGNSRQFFGPNPTETSASIGGVVSTNAGGARSFHYGPVRQQILALEVTFMSGETRTFRRGDRVDFPFNVLRAPNTTKNAAGYCLRPDLEWIDLLAGSEGTLGIISSVDLMLRTEPAAVLSGVVFFASDEAAMEAVDAWRPLPELRLLEYLDENALGLLRPQYGQIPDGSRAALMIEQNLASEDDEEVDHWTERLALQRADEEGSWFGFSAAEQEKFRAFRHLLPAMVIDRARHNGFPKFGTDFAVPLDRGREIHRFFRAECERRMKGKYTIFGHAGDANNHINLLPGNRREAEECEALMETCASRVVELGGTIAAEHGIGKIKTHLLKMMYSPEEIDRMRQVKRYLDPDWLLGQGNIFGQ